MRNLRLLLALVLLSSCTSPSKLFQRGVKNIDKAVKMDPSLKLDPDTTFVINTVEIIDTFNNVITKTVTHTITNTINDCNFDEFVTMTNRQRRIDKRSQKDSLIHLENMYSLETKRLLEIIRQQAKIHAKDLKAIRSNNRVKAKESKNELKKARAENKGNMFTRFMGRIWYLLLIGGLVGGFIVARKFYKIKV